MSAIFGVDEAREVAEVSNRVIVQMLVSLAGIVLMVAVARPMTW